MSAISKEHVGGLMAAIDKSVDDLEDLALNQKQLSSPQKSDRSAGAGGRYEQSPKTFEQIKNNIRDEIKQRKEKNEANQLLAKYKKLL